jgi:hypothetical protein
MSSSYNSIFPFSKARLDEIQEAIGITQFPSATGWYQVIGGIIVQGGFASAGDAATVTVNLNAPYEKQLLGIWIQVIGGTANAAYVTAADLDSFQIVNGVGARDFYWLSLGV